MLNALNPAFALTNSGSPTACSERGFIQPNAFAGDFRQPEQLVGQLGFRFTF